MLGHTSEFHSFLRVNNIPLYMYATFCFCIHPSVSIWVVSMHPMPILCLDFFLSFLIHLREKEHEEGRDRERGRHRIWSRLQALSCQQSPTWVSISRTSRSWPEPKPRVRHLTNWAPLNHPGAPVLRFSTNVRRSFNEGRNHFFKQMVLGQLDIHV